MTESTGVLGTLGIDLPKFLGQLFNFAVVLFVMWKWVYPPLVKLMDRRSKEIADGLANAKDAERKLSEAMADKERMMNQGRMEALALTDDAKQKAEATRQNKLKQTKEEIEKIAVEAKERLKAEREDTYGALQRDVADLVRRATEKVAAGFDEKTHRALIDKALKDLEQA